ncbi:unnamed protein product [Mytilus coruscus]|uniref:Uncharacterized protein n=1 Tax=Mytilus coruscus TaxID=42192 RepID=A0A6J8CBA8_MYTCO|nr:unnamed protein product [Mytilus coruscus]
MFVPQARIKLGNTRPSWFGGPSRKRNLPKRELKWFEFIRMPYLVPNVVGSIIGFTVLCSGALLCYIGYNPQKFFDISANSSINNSTKTSNVTTKIPVETKYTQLKSLAYVGPVLMGIGFFVLMVAVVLYCEIRDKFVQSILPSRNISNTKKGVLYDMVIDEFRKNYFRGIEVPIKKPSKRSNKVASEMPTLYKALSISTPALLITPEVQRKWLNDKKVTPKHKRKRCLSDHETWLKTSSMPNIRPKSFKRIQRRFSKYSKYCGDKNNIPKHYHGNTDDKSAHDSETTEKNSETCFSNPAFRGSPTETIELDDISTDFLLDKTNISEKSRQSEVVIHIDAHETVFDGREFTERRHSCSSNVTSSKKIEESAIPGINDDCSVVSEIHTDRGTGAISKANKKRKSLHKSQDRLDVIGKRGPYKTCIGVFRSESCLHRIRNIVNKHDRDDGDNSSLNSLTLNEEVMKFFEPSSLNNDIPKT